MIKEFCPEVNVTGVATNVEEGLKLIDSAKPDLIFLDVEMPDGDGFSLLRKIPEINFQVIFITAHEKYALRAIKFSALDYLLKPIDSDELIAAVEKAKEEINQKSTPEKVHALIQNMEDQLKSPPKLVLKDKYGVQIIATQDVIRLEASGSYTKFIVKNHEPLMISKGIKEYQDLLSSDHFFRCHQSHIINMNFLSRYDKRDGDFLYLTDGSKVPLAVRKRDVFLAKINAN